MIKSLGAALSIFTETLRYLRLGRFPDADVPQLKKEWAKTVLSRMDVRVALSGSISTESPLLLVGNHISYLDIPLLMSLVPKLSFVAKHELSQWPIFGPGAKQIDTVFVKRDQAGSRTQARESVREALNAGKRIAIFPSGTTCLTEGKAWRRGAFELAFEENVLIQPFRISYTPLRAAAFIDDDIFPLHLYRLARAGGIEAKIEFHGPIKVTDPVHDAIYWQKWSRLQNTTETTFEINSLHEARRDMSR